MASAASHVLFLTLLHGRGAFRLLLQLRLATFAGVVALAWLSIAGGRPVGAFAHAVRLALQVGIGVVIVGSWALRWQRDVMLRRFCPDDTTLYLNV